MQSALDTALGAGNTQVSSVSGAIPRLDITFTGSLGLADQPLLVVANQALTGGTSPVILASVIKEGGGALVGADQPQIRVTPLGAVLAQGSGSTQPALVVTAGSAGTVVNAGAVLEVPGGVTFREPLTLASLGLNQIPTGGLRVLDTNPLAGQRTTWEGQVTLDGPTAINVLGASDTLDQGKVGFFTSTIGSVNTYTGANTLVKVGPGTLEMSGTSSNSYTGSTYVNEGRLVLDKRDSGLNEVQTLTLGGTGSGTLRLSFLGVPAATPLNIVDEVFVITPGGTAGGTFTPSYLGTASTLPLTFQPGLSPTPALVQQSLETIPALTGNVTVSGAPGGPFTITFTGALTGVNIAAGAITTTTTGGTTAAVTNPTQGSGITATTIQNHLNTIPALSGNVTVTGPDARNAFTITFGGALAQTDVPAVLAGTGGGISASIATLTDGSTGPARLFQPTATGRGALIGQPASNPVLGGTLWIGNDAGGDDADQVVFGSRAGVDQIYSLTGVAVASSGRLDLNNRSDTIDSLSLFQGRSYSANVTLGSSGSGALTVTTNIVNSSFGATDGTAPPSQIGGSGRLVHLGGLDNLNNTNVYPTAGAIVPQGSIYVNDTFVPSKNPDLVIAATIADPTPVNGFLPGLREGVVSGNNNLAAPNPDNSFQLTTRLGEYGTSSTNGIGTNGGFPDSGLPWGNNVTWIYSGEFFDEDGIISFGATLNDSFQLKIDGVVVTADQSVSNRAVPTFTANSNTTGNNTRTTHVLYIGPGNAGWHTFEFRVGNAGNPEAGAHNLHFPFTIAPGGTAAGVIGYTSRTGLTGVEARDSFVTPLESGTMNLFRTPAVAAPYTLNKQGSGTLNLRGANTYTGGTQVNAGDLVLSGGGTANQVVRQNEVQQLKLFGSNRVGQTQSITGGTFTLSLTMPGGNTVTTGAIAFSTTPATLATNIASAINAALASFNASTNTANVASVAVAPAAGITNTSNPLVFNITFNGLGQQFINQPKITANVTNALTGAVGADIVTAVDGTGREVQTLSFAGTPGSLISFQFGGQTRSYWDETQRITVPGTFQNGDRFFLTVFGVQLPIIYDNTSTANLVANIQGVLDQAFGENIFAVSAPNVTTIDISPGTATNTLGLTPDFGAAGQTGPVLRTANLPNIQANFPVAEVQTITFPAQFVTGSTYQISFLGRTSPVFSFNAANAQTNIDNIVNFLDSFEGFAGNYLLQQVGGNVRQYTIRYQDRFAGVVIPNTPPGLSFIAVNPTNAITVANTVVPPATTQIAEFQVINTVNALNGDQINMSLNFFGQVLTATGGPLVISPGVSPTAAGVQAHLETIPPLAGNIVVIGPPGGPFGVLFINDLLGVNLSQLGFSVNTGNRSSTATLSDGSGNAVQRINFTGAGTTTFSFNGVDAAAPFTFNNITTTETALQANLETIRELAGNIIVNGDPGGPFTITFINQLAFQVINTPIVATPPTNVAIAILQPGVPSPVATLNNRQGVGNEIQQIAIRPGAATLSFAGATAPAVTGGPGLTAQAVFNALNAIPALTNNIDVFGPNGGPFTVVFFNNLATTNVPQIASSQAGANLVRTLSNGQGNEVQAIIRGTNGTIRFTYSGKPATTDLTWDTGTTAAQLLAHLNTIPALNGNVQVFGANGGPFLVRFINNLARVNAADLGVATTLADNVSPVTGTATVLLPGSGDARFAGVGEGFPGPGFEFVPGVTPSLADMQFYLNGIPAVTALSTQGNLFLQGPPGNSTGPYTLVYPAGRIIDPLKVFVSNPATTVTSTLRPVVQALPNVAPPRVQSLPAGVFVETGSTLLVDNFAQNNNNRLPDTEVVILNGGTLHFRGNPTVATQETLGQLMLAANQSNTVRVDWFGAVGSFVALTGAAGLTRLEGATLNLISNNDFAVGLNEVRFTGLSQNIPTFVGNILPWAMVTTFSGAANESVDLVTDYTLPVGGNALSLGRLLSYDPITTVNGNVKLTSTGTFTLANNINALVLDSRSAGGGITVAIDNGAGGTTVRNINSGTIITAGTNNVIGAGLTSFGSAEHYYFICGANERQTLTLTGATGGSFTLSLPMYGNVISPLAGLNTLMHGQGATGFTTAALRSVNIPVNASLTAAVIQQALEALPQIGPDNVLVTGSYNSTTGNGSFTIEFIGALAGGEMPQVRVTSLLTAGTATVATATPSGTGLTINASLSGTGQGRKDRRGKLVLAGDNNALLSRFLILNGVVTAQHDQALGAAGAGPSALGSERIVNPGAALEIQDSRTIRAHLVLGGTGYSNDNSGALRVFGTAVDGLGQPIPAVVNLPGTIVIGTQNLFSGLTNPITPFPGLNNPLPLYTAIGVGRNRDAIQDPTNTQGNDTDIALATGQVNFGPGLNTMKVGDGTLELGGTLPNIGSGTMFVNDGTLALNKQGTAQALPVNVVIGDNDGSLRGDGTQPDRVVFRDTAGTDQIANGVEVHIGRSGGLYYGTRSETLGVLRIDRGEVVGTTGALNIARALLSGARIDSSSGTFGVTAAIANSNSETAHSLEVWPSAVVSTISGNFTLNNAFRTIFTGIGGNATLDGPNLYDLVIHANITGGGTSGRLEKQGTGGVRLNGVNTGLTGSNEVQTLSVPANISRFVVNFGGATSDVINSTDSAAVVQAKLEAMPSIGIGNVVVTSNAVGSNPRTFTLTFVNALGGYDVPTATTSVVSTGVNEVQQLTFAGAPATGSTFTLSYGNLTTAPITYSTVVGTLQTNIQNALNAILGTGNTTVQAVNATTVNITFTGQLGTVDVQPLVVSGISTATGAGNALVTTTVNGSGNAIQYLRLGGSGGSAADTLTLSYGGVSTNPMIFTPGVSPTAAQVQAELSAIPALAGNVVVIGANGGPFSILFGGQLQNQPVFPINVTTTGGVVSRITPVPSSRIFTSEVQRLTFHPNVTSGTFTLTFTPPGASTADGITTAPIAFSSSPAQLAANIQAALEAPTMFGPGNVSVLSQGGGVFTVAFRGELANANLNQLIPTNSLVGSGVTPANALVVSTAFSGTGNEVQSLTFSGSPGGTIQLRFNGVAATTPLVFIPGTSPTAAQVAAALGTIGPSAGLAGLAGNVKVLGKDGGPFTVVFNNQLGGRNIPPIQALVAGNEQQRLTISGATSGTFTLTLGGLTTAPIAFNSDAATQAANIQAALNNLLNANNPAFGTNSVLVAPISTPTTSDFTITFQNALASANVPQLVPTFAGTLNPSGIASVTVATVLEGAGNSVQSLSVSGAPGGTFRMSLNGVASPGSLTFVPGTSPTAQQVQSHLSAIPADPNFPNANDEVQLLTLGGTSGGTFRLAFQGTQTAAALTFTSGLAPTAAQLQANLETIAELTGNVVVTGNAGGPFQIRFTNALSGQNVPALTVAAVTGGTSAAVRTLIEGGPSLPALSGAVKVFGPNGGPFTIVVDNATLGRPLGQPLPQFNTEVVGNEQQRISFSGTITGGTFTLSYNIGTNNLTTAPISFSSTPATLAQNIQDALNTMFFGSPAGQSGVLGVSVTAQSANDYLVTFVGPLANTNVGPLSASGAGLTGGGTVSATTLLDGAGNTAVTLTIGFGAGNPANNQVRLAFNASGVANEVQTLTNIGAAGQMILSFMGAQTATLPSTATAAQVQTALQGLATIGTGNVTVVGNPGGPYTITFTGALANTDVPLIGAQGLGGANYTVLEQTRGGPNAVGVLVDEIQTVTNAGGAGQFQLRFNGADTALLDATATASQVQLALEQLGTIGPGNVVVTGPAGGPFSVRFTGALGLRDINNTTEGLIAINTGGANFQVFETVRGGIQRTMTFQPNTSPTADQVQAHLQSIPALAGNVAVIGASGGPFTVVFNGALAGNPTLAPLLTSATTGNTAANTFVNNAPSISAISTTVPDSVTATSVQTPINPSINTEVQRLVFAGTTSGTFRLAYGNTSLTTPAITFSTNPSVMAASIQRGLDAIFGDGNTLVVPQLQANGTTATEYRIFFIRDLRNANLPQLVPISTLTPANSLSVQTVFDGLNNVVQTLTVTPGTDTPGALLTLSLDGVAGTSPLVYEPGTSPTAAQVRAPWTRSPR